MVWFLIIDKRSINQEDRIHRHQAHFWPSWHHVWRGIELDVVNACDLRHSWQQWCHFELFGLHFHYSTAEISVLLLFLSWWTKHPCFPFHVQPHYHNKLLTNLCARVIVKQKYQRLGEGLEFWQGHHVEDTIILGRVTQFESNMKNYQYNQFSYKLCFFTVFVAACVFVHFNVSVCSQMWNAPLNHLICWEKLLMSRRLPNEAKWPI